MGLYFVCLSLVPPTQAYLKQVTVRQRSLSLFIMTFDLPGTTTFPLFHTIAQLSSFLSSFLFKRKGISGRARECRAVSSQTPRPLSSVSSGRKRTTFPKHQSLSLCDARRPAPKCQRSADQRRTGPVAVCLSSPDQYQGGGAH